jgi:hypothetical protein
MMAGHKPMLRELGLYLVQLESYHSQGVHKTANGLEYPYVSSELKRVLRVMRSTM